MKSVVVNHAVCSCYWLLLQRVNAQLNVHQIMHWYELEVCSFYANPGYALLLPVLLILLTGTSSTQHSPSTCAPDATAAVRACSRVTGTRRVLAVSPLKTPGMATFHALNHPTLLGSISSRKLMLCFKALSGGSSIRSGMQRCTSFAGTRGYPGTRRFTLNPPRGWHLIVP